MFKPAAGCDVGCFGERGEVIPDTGRFVLRASLKHNLFNVFEVESDHEFRIRITGVKTKLFTTHYTGRLDNPVQLSLMNLSYHRLGTIEFADIDRDADIDREPITLQFDIDVRTQPIPTHIVFYSTRESVLSQAKNTYCDGAMLTGLKLSINANSNVVRMSDARERLQQLTAENFPEYLPRIDKRGGVFILPFGDLPFTQMDSSRNNLHGSCTWECEPWPHDHGHYPDIFTVWIALMFKDKILDVHKNYVQGRRL